MKSRQCLDSSPMKYLGKRHPPPLSPLVVFVSAMSTRSGWVAWGRTRCASILCIFRRLDFGFLKENSPVNVWLKWVTCRTKCGLVFCIFTTRVLVQAWNGSFLYIFWFSIFPPDTIYIYEFAQNYLSFYGHQFHKRLTNYTVNKHVETSDQQLLLVVILFLVAIIQTNNALFRPSTASILLRSTGENS